MAYGGTFYIVYTVSMQDLILNCVALEIILNIDELVFEVLAPRSVRTLVDALAPLQLNESSASRMSVVETIVALTFLISGLAAVSASILSGFVHDLEGLQNILCGGNLELVFRADEAGAVWGSLLPSAPKRIELSDRQADVFGYASSDVREGLDIEDWNPNVYPLIANVFPAHRMMELISLQDADFNIEIEDDSPYKPHIHILRSLLQDPLANCSTWAEKQAQLQYDDSVFDDSAEDMTQRLSAAASQAAARICQRSSGCFSPLTGWLLPVTENCPVSAYSTSSFQHELRQLPCNDNIQAGSWTQAPGSAGIGDIEGYMTCQEFLDDHPDGNYCTDTKLPAVCPVTCGCSEAAASKFCPPSCWK